MVSQAGDATVVVAESRPFVAECLAAAIDLDGSLRVARTAYNGDDALSASLEVRPRLLLLSHTLTGLPILATAMTVRRESPPTRIVLFVSDLNDRAVALALKTKPDGIVTTSESREGITRSLRRIAEGTRYYSQDIRGRLNGRESRAFAPHLSEVKPTTPLESLTKRELEILSLVATGKSKKEIAIALNRSLKTVDNHVTNLMTKLDIHDRVELARYAIREGIVSA